jgi:cell division protein FtsB
VSEQRTSSVRRPPARPSSRSSSRGSARTAAARTTTARPPQRRVTGRAARPTATRPKRSSPPKSDLTRSIRPSRRITTGRAATVALVVGSLLALAAIAAALFVLPVRTWFEQNDDLEQRANEVAELDRVNTELQAEVDRLTTDDGIREAAREELGYVTAGETRQSVLPLPDLPAQLPAGWPYDLVTEMIAVRAAPPPPVPATDAP